MSIVQADCATLQLQALAVLSATVKLCTAASRQPDSANVGRHHIREVLQAGRVLTCSMQPHCGALVRSSISAQVTVRKSACMSAVAWLQGMAICSRLAGSSTVAI